MSGSRLELQHGVAQQRTRLAAVRRARRFHHVFPGQGRFGEMSCSDKDDETFSRSIR
jgi:hypothetical protein